MCLYVCLYFINLCIYLYLQPDELQIYEFMNWD